MARRRIVLCIAAFVFWVEASAQTITRGPYLQSGTPTSVFVKWRTDVASTSRVEFGFTPDILEFAVEDTHLTTEHEVLLSGLTADTKYYYAIGAAGVTLAGDSSYFFVTSPEPGAAKPTRIWILGDSGTKNNAARAVRDTYYAFTGDRHTDLWLMLGDNAYPNGLDSEYQAAVFDMYPEMLRKSVLWPTRGNHDRGPRDEFGNWTEGGDYYRIFTLPTAGEAGGMPSGTEVYYSFDYGDIHFICLESTSSSFRGFTSPMWSWLEADLAANDKFWTIAFWHHPPYSKGSHDSDAESELIQMRERALPLLESYGVDLVLCGHSHSYERSFLLNGHYGNSTTLADSMILDAGAGRRDDGGAYVKFTSGPQPGAGAVYIVAGSSGQLSPGPLNHPVMFASFEMHGSVVLDIDGDQLEASFINSSGAILDYFTIIKSSGSAAAKLIPVSGGGQTGFVGTSLSEPFTVQAQDSSGQPIFGVSINFAIIAGEGVLSRAQKFSDLNGRASSTLKLGEAAGLVRVAVTAAGVADTVFFMAHAIVPPFPDISVVPVEHNFGDVLIGDSSRVQFQIKNLGVEDLTVSSLSMIGGDSAHFRMDSLSLPFTLETNESQILLVHFKPISVGVKQAAVNVSSNDPDENPLAVMLTGIAASEFPPVIVLPKITTTSTPSNADDPAIWIHPSDPSRSVIIGTDKSAGIFVWDLNGSLLQHLPQGADVNNVDARQRVRWGNEVADIVAANLRNAGKLAVFKVNPNYTGADVLVQLAGENSSGNDIQEDSYGFCLYKNPDDRTLYVFERPKDGGVVRQYRIEPDSTGAGVVVTPVRDLNYAGGVAEGFVADDELGYVYITEESHGIHKFFAAPDQPVDALATFGQGAGTQTDREGLALYACPDGAGYLVLSSQGNDTFKIFERQGNNRFVKTVTPLDEFGNPGLGTDGLDVTSFAAPPNFPQGFLVAHEQDGKQFHLYDWADVAKSNLSICVNGVFPKPQIAARPSAFDFGNVAVGDSGFTTLVIKNLGAAELLVTSIAMIPDDEFRIDSGWAPPRVIAFGDSLPFDVAFLPKAAGTKNAVVQLTSNDESNNPLEIFLTGTGILFQQPQIAVAPAAVDFGEVAVGDTAVKMVMVKNLGNTTLTLSEVSVYPFCEFTIDSVETPLLLTPLDSFQVVVNFVPASAGEKNAALRLVSSDPQSDTLEVRLTAQAFLPALIASTDTLDFEQVFLDSATARPVFLFNRNDHGLRVLDIEVLGEHASEFRALNEDTAFVIAAQDSKEIIVEFTPRSTGKKNAQLRILSSVVNFDSVIIVLTGEALAPPILGTEEDKLARLPDRTVLFPNYPNPFNAETTIEYALPRPAQVRLIIYNLLGQPIRTLIDNAESAGFKKARWDGRDQNQREVGSGIYYVKLEVDKKFFVHKIVLLK